MSNCQTFLIDFIDKHYIDATFEYPFNKPSVGVV